MTDKVFVRTSRKTFIKGDFKGKYHSEFDQKRSYSDMDRFYLLNIYESEVSNGVIIKEENYTDKISLNENIILQQPLKFCTISDNTEHYFFITLKEYQIENIRISNIVSESTQSFGTITGTITGYIEDLKEEEKIIPDVSREEPASETKPVQNSFSSDIPSGISSPNHNPGCLNIGTGFISVLLILSIFKWVWPFFLIIGLFRGFRFFSSRYGWVGRIGSYGSIAFRRLGIAFFFLLLLLFWGFVIYALFKGFTHSDMPHTEHIAEKKDETEMPRVVEDDYIPHETKLPKHHTENKHQQQAKKDRPDNNSQEEEDSLIIHTLSWQDYSENIYSGDFIINKYDYAASQQNRKNLNPGGNSAQNYWNSIYSSLAINDYQKLDHVYAMLDSIKSNSNLSARNFADVVVSCIQQIPYVLVLDNQCDPNMYQQAFIKDYLTRGQSCECCTKFGLYSPAEFCGNLKGDCDTRTLLLFTMLSRFGYDVVILNSDVLNHSIIGLNIPSSGVFKYFNNKKYYVWETTVQGLELGQVPPALSNMRLWNVILANKNL
jgi:hypothetical protein